MLRGGVLPPVHVRGTLAHFFVCFNQKAMLKKLEHIQSANVRFCPKSDALHWICLLEVPTACLQLRQQATVVFHPTHDEVLHAISPF